MTAWRPFLKSRSLVVAISAGLFLLATGNIALARHHHHHHHKPVHGTGTSHDPIVRHPVHGTGSSHNPIVRVPVHGTGSSHNPIVNCPSGRGGGTGKCGYSPR